MVLYCKTKNYFRHKRGSKIIEVSMNGTMRTWVINEDAEIEPRTIINFKGIRTECILLV